MSDIEFPNYANTFILSTEAGRRAGVERAHQNALSMIGTDPQGAQNALMQTGDFQGAEAIGQVSARQAQTAARASAAALYAKGDTKGAISTAMTADPALAEAYVKLDDHTQAVMKEVAAKRGAVAFHLAQDFQKDPAAATQQWETVIKPEMLRQQLLTQADLVNMPDPHTNPKGFVGWLDHSSASSMTAVEQMNQADKDRTFGETVRSHKATEAHQDATLKETAGYHQGELGVSRARLGVEQDRLRFDQSQKAEAVFDPATITAMAQQAWAGDKSVFSNLGRGVQGAQNIAALRKEIYAQGALNGKTPTQLAQMNAQFMGDAAAARTAGSRVGAASVSTEELPGLVQQSSEAYSKLPRTQFKPFNQLQQAVMNQTASPEQAAAYAADFAVVNAYARAVSPSGQPHVADQKRGAELLSNVSGPAEHDAVLKQIIKETAVIKAGAQRALHPESGGAAPAGGARPPLASFQQ
jgi:hypothetical protein